MKTSKRVLAALLAAAFLAGAAPLAALAEVAAPPRPAVREVDSTFISRSGNMSLKLLRELRKEAPGENTVFSPLSIQYILAILNNAADSSTHKAINKFWNYPASTPASTFNGELQNIHARYQRYYQNQESARFDVANAMFVQKGYAIAPASSRSWQITTLRFAAWISPGKARWTPSTNGPPTTPTAASPASSKRSPSRNTPAWSSSTP